MKYGNKKVRWILIQAANTAARKDDRLRKFYLRIAKRHVAITHVAITHVATCVIHKDCQWFVYTDESLTSKLTPMISIVLPTPPA